MEWRDRSVIEAASWRLASELVRRHPDTTRLLRTHPGGGTYDCLSILPTNADKGDVELNRNGTIQVLQRFDGRPADTWDPTEWDEYLRADPREFLLRLESAAGLASPSGVPAATPTTLTCRILAAIASTAVKSIHPVDIQSGYIDTAGYGGGPNDALNAFSTIDAELLRPQSDDLFDQPGYRFWIVLRDDAPLLAFEQREALAWTLYGDHAIPVMKLYRESRRHLLVTALELLRRADNL